jgi:chromosome transmission fidelity protein 18
MEQYSMQRLHIPSVAAAIHLLCRVELKPDLSFSTREMSDAHYQRDANRGLVQKFSEALPVRAKGFKCQDLLSTEFIPLALWILSAGEGNSSLCRSASSIDVLTKLERGAVDTHVGVLRSLGLTYVADHEQHKLGQSEDFMDTTANTMRMEPPIDRLVHYVHIEARTGLHRKAIPLPVSRRQVTPLEELIFLVSNTLTSFAETDERTDCPSGKARRLPPARCRNELKPQPQTRKQKSTDSYTKEN